MKRAILYIVFTFCFSVLFAQKELEKADFAFRMKDYYEALVEYQKMLNNPALQLKDSVKMFITYRIGECYKAFLHYKDANKWFEKALNMGYSKPQIYLSYASTLIMNAEYEKARELLETYFEFVPQNAEAEILHRSCEFALRSSKETVLYEALNASRLNTEFSDYGLGMINPHTLLISSSRGERDPNNYFKYNGQPYSDFFISYYNKDSARWSDPVKFSTAINSPYNEGTISFCPANKTAYFMQCNGYDGKDSVCNIYYSRFDESTNTWSKPKLFEIHSKVNNLGHPAISSNGKYLFFVSDMPGGMGRKDIWYSELGQDGKWTKPQNAGPNINTAGDEMFPYLFEDSVLYFSSNGRVGFGGLDIYYSLFRNNTFSKAENLEKPFNSSADDFGILLLNWDSGFFCSNRSGGLGDDDIYSFRQTEAQIKVNGTVSDHQTGEPVEHSFVVIQGSDGYTDSTWTDSKGFYAFNTLRFGVDYVVSAHKEGYLGDSKSFTTKNVKKPRELPREKRYIMDLQLDLNMKVDLDFKLVKITKDEIKINNIYYDFGRWDLRDSSKKELDKLVHLLNVNPTVKILINSHTDARSSEEFNLKLSQNRAQSVVNYLIEKGVAAERLLAKGWGKSKLLIRNATTEEEHQLNRRTTFSIVNYKEVAEGYSTVKYDNIPNIHGKAFPEIPKEITPERKVQEGTVIKIQLAASATLMADQVFITLQDSLKDQKIEYRKYSDGMYRYTLGNFTDYKEANFLLEKVHSFGIDAFLIAVRDNRIVPLSEVVSNLSGNTNTGRISVVPEKSEKNVETNNDKPLKENTVAVVQNNNTKLTVETNSNSAKEEIKTIKPARIVAEGTILKVQIAASRFLMPDKSFEVIRDNIKDFTIDMQQDEDGYYRYTMGNFTSYEEANELMERLEKIGFKSFLIAYRNGARISLFEALKNLNVKTNQKQNPKERQKEQKTSSLQTANNATVSKDNNKSELQADSGVYLRIQLAAARNPLPDSLFLKIKKNLPQYSIDVVKESDDFYRYYYGIFKDYALANITLNKIKDLGYKAFMVGFRKDEKISLYLALKYLENEKKP